jgi:site-specific recombinase XerD
VGQLLELPDKEPKIIDYILQQKGFKSRQLTINTLKKFYEMNDVILNWKKITCYMGEEQKLNEDRCYTHEEIQRLLNVCDLRMKMIVLLMASSGMRIGALPTLCLGQISKHNTTVTVYAGTKDKYITFITPECKAVIDSYLAYRVRSGEKLGPDSPLIRKQFDINDLEQVRKQSEPVALHTLSKGLENYLIKAGLRSIDHTANKRKEIARAHGFRKFFTTQLINSKVNPEIREMLLGHSIGLAGAYYKPTEDEMLDEYMKAADNLTINEENRLRKKVEVLTIEKSKVDLALSQIDEMKKRIGLT